MKYLMMMKVDENSGMPPQALFDAMDVYIEKQRASGVLLETAGLMPSAMGKQIRITKGKINVIDGPFTESKEFMQLHVDNWPEWEGASEVRQIAPM